MQYVIIIVVSYLLGCFPSAFLVVKLFSGKDIRKCGTGRIGTANTFDVLGGRKLPALLVLLADLAKGVLAVALSAKFAGTAGIPFAAVAACIGHNKNIFLHFNGGRGLAVAAGSLLLVNPLPVLIWLSVWCCGLIFRLNMDKKNIIASLVCGISIFLIPADFAEKFTACFAVSVFRLQIMVVILNLLALQTYLEKK